ncbi:MAG: recombination protein RecR [Butyricimonas faecalis]
MQSLSSKLLEKAVEQFASLPGIGRKTALRYVLHMLRQSPEEVKQFTDSITALKESIKECTQCHNISDSDICDICSDPKRDTQTLCVVENIKDIMSSKPPDNTTDFTMFWEESSPHGRHWPSDLHINSLLNESQSFRERGHFALGPPSKETPRDITSSKTPAGMKSRSALLAKGIAIGNDLEYTDELTLGRSLVNRVKFSLNG